jgi:N-acetylneuraminic acid mutarotase
MRMKKLFLLVMVLVSLGGCKKSSVDYIGNWIKQGAFDGYQRGGAVSFVIGDKVYFGTGFNSNLDTTYLKDFRVLDPTMNTWLKLGDFPGEPRQGAVAFAIDGKGYMGLGYNGHIKLKDFWEFDPTTKSWTQKADFLGTARYGAVGFALGTKGYVGTGYDNNDTKDFYQYDPATDQWSQIASIGGDKRQYGVAFTINSKAYVCTGVDNGINLVDMWEFDPSTGKWTEKNKLTYNTSWTITRSGGTGFALGSKGYVCLGYNSGVRKDCWEYDPTLDTWTNKTDFEGSARQNACCYVLNNRAFIMCGQSSSYFFDDVWELKPFDALDTDD